MTPLVLHLMGIAKISRIPRSSSVNATKAIKEKIVMISMNAVVSILVKTMESVKINLERSNATAEVLDLKEPHVRIHAMPTEMIVKTEGFAKNKIMRMLVTAKTLDIQETFVTLISMNVKLGVHAKTMVLAKIMKVVLPVIAKTLHIKDPIATNLNTVSTVFPDLIF